MRPVFLYKETPENASPSPYIRTPGADAPGVRNKKADDRRAHERVTGNAEAERLRPNCRNVLAEAAEGTAGNYVKGAGGGSRGLPSPRLLLTTSSSLLFS